MGVIINGVTKISYVENKKFQIHLQGRERIVLPLIKPNEKNTNIISKFVAVNIK